MHSRYNEQCGSCNKKRILKLLTSLDLHNKNKQNRFDNENILQPESYLDRETHFNEEIAFGNAN